MPVYQVLEEIMKEQNRSIADVAKVCNVPDSTVRGIIRRKQETIALEVAFKLSNGLHVSLERLNGMPEKLGDGLEEEKPTPVAESGLALQKIALIQKILNLDLSEIETLNQMADSVLGKRDG